jgi:hypothetical protein
VAIVVRLTCENPEEVLSASWAGPGAVIQLQRATDEAFTTPVDVTTAALVAGTRIYVVLDSAGTASTWYRSRYETSGGASMSDWTAAFLPGDETAGLICSLYDAKQRILGSALASTDTTLDEEILEYIRQATALIENRTGRFFTADPLSGASTFYLNGTGTDRIHIPRGIRSITSIAFATSDQPSDGSGTYSSITATRVYLEPEPIQRLRGWPAFWIVLGTNAETTFFPAVRYGVKLVAATGWAASPYDIQQVGLDLVVAAHRGRGAAGYDAITMNAGGERVFSGMLSAENRRTLQFYTDGSALVA